MHLTSTVSYTTGYSFLTSYKVLLDHPTDGHKLVSKAASYEKAATGGYSEYPFYGASANMNTVMANLAGNNYFYYLRVYDVALTDLQVMQNHFADLMYYNKIDTAKFDALSDSSKVTLYAFASDYQLSDTGAKAAIETKINELANGETVIRFAGYQARLHSNVGIRSVFYLDNASLAEMGITVKVYGAIVAVDQGDTGFDELVISYDEENGVSASQNFRITASTDTSFKTIGNAEKAYILNTTEGIGDYTMFAYTVDFLNGSIDENGTVTGTSSIDGMKDVELLFRSYAVLECRGVTYIVYADGASDNYNNSSVSLAEISDYYAAYNNGEFATNVCIQAVVGAPVNEE